MIFIYSVGGILEHRNAGEEVPAGGSPVAMVKDGKLELLVPAANIDIPSLRTIANQLTAEIPVELQAVPLAKEAPKTEAKAEATAPTFADLKSSWLGTLGATAKAVRKEFDLVTSGAKSSSSSEGSGLGSSVKSAYAKFTIKGLSKMQRNLFVLSAKLAEEKLCNDLEKMSSEERKAFYELYRKELEALSGTPDGKRLASWEKPIRRACTS